MAEVESRSKRPSGVEDRLTWRGQPQKVTHKDPPERIVGSLTSRLEPCLAAYGHLLPEDFPAEAGARWA
jgi:hypothetical protein